MFSKASLRFLVRTWHPDYTLENGVLDVLQQVAHSVAQLILDALPSGDLQRITQSVNRVVPDRISRRAHTYLKHWEKMSKSTNLVEMKHAHNINGIYPWPITLKLNPQILTRELKKSVNMTGAEYVQVAAYLTYVVELVLGDVFACIDKNASPRISVSQVQACAHRVSSSITSGDER